MAKQRKVILYMAVSLDGYIADAQGGVEWLETACPEQTDTQSYPAFIAGIDTVILGRRTYEQIVTELSPEVWPYADLDCYVLTHHPPSDQPGIHFRSQPLAELLHTLKQTPGRDIWLCGGADLVRQARQQDLIDRYHLTLIPLLLGQGLPLFPAGAGPCALTLHSVRPDGAFVDILYDRQRPEK